MRTYLLLFLSILLLLFALPKNSSLRSFAQQAELKKACSYSKRFVKKTCARKCLKHQTHSENQNNAANLGTDCNQQVYALVSALQAEPLIYLQAKRAFKTPLVRKHLSPDLEHDPEPPRFS
ncbi:hypothetical protein [Pontibacter cellulosilyticus]|uniref:Uncharacterized protein n=1 Tax=Pontibacter cellulosilyticus TaxID=1720253 RepID=A0A923N7L1_9BACT|nr:hypothetical protein [Pontibacter cellulosilyticus]MBC5994380.1 hypothetical protein [Pontibacter cellulosilyticus]